MWPNVLLDMKEKIDERLAKNGEVVQVYLGGDSGIPTINQINLMRGNTVPEGEQSYCTGSEDELTVFIEIWVNEEFNRKELPKNATSAYYENQRTLKGYQKLALLSDLVRSIEFESNHPSYSSEFIRQEADQDEFRPTVAERITYKIELKGVSYG